MSLFNWTMKGFNTERREAGQAPTATLTAQPPVQNPIEPHLSETPADKASAVLFNFAPQSPQFQVAQPGFAFQNSAPGFNSAFAGATLGNRHIMVVTPHSDSEIVAIVEHLRTNEAVIVNFEGVPAPDTQRRIDFLSGVACGLGGTIHPLDAYKYIITPSGIGVR